MFNFAKIKARFKAEVREAKRFFNRKEKLFEQTNEHLKLDAPKPKVIRAKHTSGPARVGFGTFSRVKRLRRFQTDHSFSATIHRARVAGKEKTRYELRHLVA